MLHARNSDPAWCEHTSTPFLRASLAQVDAQLTAANIPHELFDAIVSADVFERLKPAPGAAAPT